MCGYREWRAITKGSENVITNGSIIAVADGQCMILVDQGKVTEFCAEPGEFTYDGSTEPSLFSGNLGQSLVDTFKTIGKRFTFGGETPKDQRIYYFNTKEILDNKFGTPTPIMFEVVNKRIGMSRTVNLRFNGVYTYIVSDPLLFYTRLAGNVAEECTRDLIDGQLKADFIDALQPAVGVLSEQELRPAQLPAKADPIPIFCSRDGEGMITDTILTITTPQRHRVPVGSTAGWLQFPQSSHRGSPAAPFLGFHHCI